MRILWLAPMFRSTARIRTQELRSLGAEVQLIATDRQYPEYGPPAAYETVLKGRPWNDLLLFYRTYREARRFKPDIVVTEYLGDPRWKLLAALAPRIRFVHDAEPHDEGQGLPWWNRILFERWDAKADATLVFSQFVAKTGLRKLGESSSPIYVAPLHSDLNPELIPPVVPTAEKRNFIMFGRQRPYKNHAVVFAAWQAHVSGPAWRGDELIIYGDGDIPVPLPEHSRWIRGDYQYQELIRELSRAKASIVHYTGGASQSGVQVLSLQLGIPPLVSTGGGLPEYQPEGFSVTGIQDVEGLAQAMDALADPDEVERQSRIAVEHYRKNFDASVFARRFLEVATEVIGDASDRGSEQSPHARRFPRLKTDRR